MTHICESHYNSLTWHGYFHCLWPWPFLSIYRNLVRCNNGHITEIHTGAGQGTESKVKSALQRRCHIFSIELFHAFLPCIPNVFARVFENKTKRSRSEVEVHHQSWRHYLHFMPCQKLLLIGPAEAGTAPLFSQEPGTIEDFCYEKQYGTVDGRLPTAVGMHLNCRIPSTTSTIIESE